MSFSGCYTDIVDPGEQLPPITTTGEYTFGCMINDQLFIATPTNTWGLKDIGATTFNHKSLTVFGKSRRMEQDIFMRIHYSHGQVKLPLFRPGDTESGFITEVWDYGFNYYGNKYVIDSNAHSELHLLIDNSYVIAGTFEFDAIGRDYGDTLHIRQGRFDIPK